VLQVQDQTEGKYVKHFEEIYEILDCKDSEFEVCTGIAKEALLALAVRQVHQAKEAKTKVVSLLDQPSSYLFDAEKYRLGLSTAQDNYLAAFSKNSEAKKHNSDSDSDSEGGKWLDTASDSDDSSSDSDLDVRAGQRKSYRRKRSEKRKGRPTKYERDIRRSRSESPMNDARISKEKNRLTVPRTIHWELLKWF
jgi:hypothetical protein